jgi:hypothetical protein
LNDRKSSANPKDKRHLKKAQLFKKDKFIFCTRMAMITNKAEADKCSDGNKKAIGFDLARFQIN